MKIVHVDSGRSWRGGQQQIALLIRRLAGFGATSVLAAPSGPLSEQLASEIGVRRWESRGDLDIGALLRLRAILRRERPDVVHLHSGRAHALGVPAARWARVRHVVASRRVAVPPGRDPASRLKYRMPVDRWLCVSEAVRDALRKARVAEARLSVVPSGIDVAALRASAAERPGAGTALRAELGIEPDAPLLFTVASLTEEKGHAALLDVAGALSGTAAGAHFVWIGDGPERAALLRARAARGLEGRIHLLGRRDDVAPLVSAATLLLVPSWNEGFCTAALEAEALGVPVVAMRVGGLPEAVADGVSGVLVPPRSAPAMAAAVSELLNNPARRASMGDAGRSHADAFDASRTAARTWAIYQEVVRSS